MNQVQIMKRQNTLPTPQELQNFINLANVLASSPFYAKMGPGGVLSIYLSALELGLPPMMCLNKGMYNIEGCITLSAQLMNMMIVNAGHRADVLYLNEQGCKIRFVRSDREKGQGDSFDYEYTMNDAQRAGYLHKDNWKKTPRDMLYSRCLSGGARKFMPDALMNCYIIGEMPGDDKLENTMPELSASPQQNTAMIQAQLIEQCQPLPLKAERYDEFVAKHELVQGSRKFQYIERVLEASAKSGRQRDVIDVINGAMKDEQKFLDAYHGWEMKQVGKREEPELPAPPMTDVAAV